MRTPAALLTCALLLPSAAAAQVAAAGEVVVNETNSTLSDGIINAAECNKVELSRLSVHWAVGATLPTSAYIQAFATDGAFNAGDCTVSSGTRYQLKDGSVTNIPVTSTSGRIPTNTTQTFLAVDDILSKVSIGCTANTTVAFCVQLFDASTNVAVATSGRAVGSMSIDVLKPSTPGTPTVEAGDSALNVSWTAGSNASGTTDFYLVRTTLLSGGLPSGTPLVSGVIAASTLSYRQSGLVNGSTYQVTVTAYSPGQNASDTSAAATGTPIPVDDFWRHYTNSGGREEGGCAGGQAGLLALLGLGLLPLARRRRGRRP